MWTVLAAIFLLFFGAAPAGAKPLSSFMQGNWAGGAYSSDKTEAFSHCAASSPYRNGVSLLVSVNRAYYWSIAFVSEEWNLPEGTSYPLRIRIDRSPWLDVTGTVVIPQMIEVPMPDESTLVTLFRRGQVMDWGFGQTVLSFNLTGTFRLLGRLADCVEERLAMESDRPATRPTIASNQPAESPTEPKLSSGSGIIVSTSGHIVSNAHVVKDCTTVGIRRPGDVAEPADVIIDDPTNDLALMKADITVSEAEIARLTAGRSPPAGERIAVYGFPLAGALSSTGNIVEGNITSAAGLADDINHFQISAPIQPGNSGGPLLDFGGGIVGVVNAKLNEVAWASKTGTLPQNVNFAIKGNVLENFLEAHSVPYVSKPRGEDLTLVQIAERAKRFTVLVVCLN